MLLAGALLVGLASAQSPVSEAWGRLEELSEAGYPDIAAAEVMKALSANPAEEDAAYWRLRLARFQGGQGHRRAQDYVLAQGVALHPDYQAWFALARLEAAAEQQDWARLLELDLPTAGPPEAVDGGHILRAHAWIALDAAPAATVELQQVQGPLRPVAASLLQEVPRWEPPRHRSPSLAGALSVVPGLGQVYAGRPTGGFFAAALVAGAGAGSLASYRREQIGSSVALGALGAAVWISSGRAAKAIARDFNNEQRLARQRALWRVGGLHLEQHEAPRSLDLGVEIHTGDPSVTATSRSE